ncbi:Mini-ribonuclease 3 [Clostridium sp. CM028]|uniref:Mini-ribonuclease 3 n=1 Tax=unclassified Clostridium TaxID=2614128 RepID=UPI001C0D64F6|nr:MULTISPECIES: ribonuclease III domain-containing protein [unclassified Clostridium]MBU3091339.1 Mini-ribonuclease 3 [Clostridium sp. CF011]MBW9145072.1 Mini-ribonuclease 3 [Clostridium sp. CM027]MBW9148312.1 Mini-ribonuclease 3 [Clostridium sp. CM028]UVE40210.1 Mini-ribonuclease 3 [Clostridium sp. CM027]WAG69154.1 Mini-ribonuclease 3 [Clostridium sp. CF011]
MEFNMLKGKFTVEQVKQINPLVLALVGDAVYEVFIRTYLVEKNRNMNVHKIHIKTVEHVKAHAQSEYMKFFIENLNEEELSIFKRARNSKSGTTPKNGDLNEYKWATGFEALVGFLYLSEKNERLNYIFEKIINHDLGAE